MAVSGGGGQGSTNPRVSMSRQSASKLAVSSARHALIVYSCGQSGIVFANCQRTSWMNACASATERARGADSSPVIAAALLVRRPLVARLPVLVVVLPVLRRATQVLQRARVLVARADPVDDDDDRL